MPVQAVRVGTSSKGKPLYGAPTTQTPAKAGDVLARTTQTSSGGTVTVARTGQVTERSPTGQVVSSGTYKATPSSAQSYISNTPVQTSSQGAVIQQQSQAQKQVTNAQINQQYQAYMQQQQYKPQQKQGISTSNPWQSAYKGNLQIIPVKEPTWKQVAQSAAPGGSPFFSTFAEKVSPTYRLHKAAYEQEQQKVIQKQVGMEEYKQQVKAAQKEVILAKQELSRTKEAQSLLDMQQSKIQSGINKGGISYEQGTAQLNALREQAQGELNAKRVAQRIGVNSAMGIAFGIGEKKLTKNIASELEAKGISKPYNLDIFATRRITGEPTSIGKLSKGLERVGEYEIKREQKFKEEYPALYKIKETTRKAGYLNVVTAPLAFSQKAGATPFALSGALRKPATVIGTGIMSFGVGGVAGLAAPKLITTASAGSQIAKNIITGSKIAGGVMGGAFIGSSALYVATAPTSKERQMRIGEIGAVSASALIGGSLGAKTAYNYIAGKPTLVQAKVRQTPISEAGGTKIIKVDMLGTSTKKLPLGLSYKVPFAKTSYYATKGQNVINPYDLMISEKGIVSIFGKRVPTSFKGNVISDVSFGKQFVTGITKAKGITQKIEYTSYSSGDIVGIRGEKISFIGKMGKPEFMPEKLKLEIGGRATIETKDYSKGLTTFSMTEISSKIKPRKTFPLWLDKKGMSNLIVEPKSRFSGGLDNLYGTKFMPSTEISPNIKPLILHITEPKTQVNVAPVITQDIASLTNIKSFGYALPFMGGKSIVPSLTPSKALSRFRALNISNTLTGGDFKPLAITKSIPETLTKTKPLSLSLAGTMPLSITSPVTTPITETPTIPLLEVAPSIPPIPPVIPFLPFSYDNRQPSSFKFFEEPKAMKKGYSSSLWGQFMKPIKLKKGKKLPDMFSGIEIRPRIDEGAMFGMKTKSRKRKRRR